MIDWTYFDFEHIEMEKKKKSVTRWFFFFFSLLIMINWSTYIIVSPDAFMRQCELHSVLLSSTIFQLFYRWWSNLSCVEKSSGYLKRWKFSFTTRWTVELMSFTSTWITAMIAYVLFYTFTSQWMRERERKERRVDIWIELNANVNMTSDTTRCCFTFQFADDNDDDRTK